MAIKDDLPEGLYVLRNLVDSDLVLDAQDKGGANGTNLMVCQLNYGSNQVFQLLYNDDGTAYLICKWNGKCADVQGGAPTKGANVHCWDYLSLRNQIWTIEQGTQTKTIGDKTLQSYYLQMGTDTGYYMEVEGDDKPISGSNVQIWTKDSGLDQQWLFDPLDVIHEGGVYEIRTMSNTNNNLENGGGADYNGKGKLTYAHNDTNNQKWVLIKDGDNWKLRVGSSTSSAIYYLDAGTGTPASGDYVTSWTEDTTRNQTWTLETVSTTVIEGQSLPVVRIHPSANTDIALDNIGNNPASYNWVRLFTNHDNDNALRWALLPTTLTDELMPVPNIQGWTSAIGENSNTSLQASHSDGEVYLCGTCPQSWTTKNGNSYRLRWRTRTFTPKGVWSDWSDYEAWQTPLMRQITPNWWYSRAFNESDMDATKALRKQYQFEICTQGTDEYSNVKSSIGTNNLYFDYLPTITLTGATLTTKGLRFIFDSDYPLPLSFYVSSITCDGKEVLIEPITALEDEDNSTFDVVFDNMKSIPADGSTLSVQFNIGTDFAGKFNTELTQSVPVTYGAGNVDKYPLTLKDSNIAGNQQKWYFAPSNDTLTLITSAGKRYPLTKSEDGNWLIPVCNEDMTLIGLWENEDASEWCARADVIKANAEPFHGFTWGEEDGVVVWLNKDDVLTEERNISAEAEEHTLLGRAHPYVSYLANQQDGKNYTKVSASVKGYIVPDRLEDYGTTPASVERMLEVGHCLYRSPKGRIAPVAVTEASLTFEHDLIEISISYVEESL